MVIRASQSMSIISVIASIYGVRMLGLFMLLPVLSLHVDYISGATPFTIGIALGSYGLMQALLQIPFAILSDYIGRRNVLLIGLALFMFGSVVAYMADDILFLIVGRLIQGAGAIAGVLFAALGDWIPDEKRVRANAFVGLSIAMAFVLALLCAPLVDSKWGLKGIFMVNSISAGLALFATQVFLPKDKPRQKRRPSISVPSNTIIDLCVGVFLLHMMLTACFLVVPNLLVEVAGISKEDHWSAYLVALCIAVPLAWPMLRKRGNTYRAGSLGAVILLSIAVYVLANASTSIAVLIGLGVFLAGFGALESFFPALLARRLPSTGRGVGSGYYSTAQFIGSFAGGFLGGLLLSYWSGTVLLYCITPLMLLWAMVFIAPWSPKYA